MKTNGIENLQKDRCARQEKGRTHTNRDSQDIAKITLLVETNPKREGSAAHGRFGLYKTGMTVAAFLAAGGTRSDLRWDSARNFVRIE